MTQRLIFFTLFHMKIKFTLNINVKIIHEKKITGKIFVWWPSIKDLRIEIKIKFTLLSSLRSI